MDYESIPPKNKKYKSLVVTVIVSFVLIAIAFLAVNFRQNIIDLIWYYQYKPTADIAALADRSGMSDTGKYYFYISRPKLDGTQTFNNLCGRNETTSSILGCYSDYRIYVYDVTDDRLDGIREVTAAHEMLHSVYQRMSGSEKAEVDDLIEQEYTKLQNNKEITDLVAYFAKSEPGQRDNELHSIIGTKISNLIPALEAHYKKFFADRSQVVSLNEKYSDVFNKLTAQATALANELNTLSEKITSESNQYNIDLKQLNSDIAVFNVNANSGIFSSQAEFYNERNSLNNRVAALNVTRTTINNDISSYNVKLNAYKELAAQSDELYDSIDSTLAPVESL